MLDESLLQRVQLAVHAEPFDRGHRATFVLGWQSAAADRTLEEAALLVPLLLVIIALMALALLDMPRVHWRRVLLPVQSDPRSPPRR